MQQIQEWFANYGDYNESIRHDLNQNSVVIDVGAFRGVWADKMISLYNPYMVLIEPVLENYLFLLEKYKYNSKIKIINCAVSTENKKIIFYDNGDAASIHTKNGNEIIVECVDIRDLLYQLQLEKIDLIQINIEGEEYNLLEHMINFNLLETIEKYQIQFHLGIDNCIERRKKIQQSFKEKNFKTTYNYNFVWECHQKEYTKQSC